MITRKRRGTCAYGDKCPQPGAMREHFKKQSTALSFAFRLTLTVLALFVSATASAVQFIYWADTSRGTISRINADGTGQTDLITGLINPFGIDLDTRNQHIYYTRQGTGTPGSGIVYRSDYDGSNTTIIHSGLTSARPVALDLVNDKLYYTSGGDIYKSNLDGSSSAIFLNTTDVEDMELDVANSRLYYVQDSGARKLARINLDGTGDTVVRTGLSDPEGLGLDLTNNIAYIVNEGSSAVNIQKTEIPTSTTLTTIVTGFTSGPEDVEVDVANSTIYYTAPGALYKNSTSGGSQTAVTTTNITSPNDLVLLNKVNFFWDDSTTTALWTTDNNWVENVAPTTGADVFFENDYGTGAETVNVNTSPTVQSLNFDNPTAYTLNNNTITLSDNGGSVGIFVDDTNGIPGSPITHTINSAITLSDTATIDNMTTGANTNLALNGNVSMGANDLTINSDGGGVEIGGSSVLSGSGDITKTGTGTLTLSSSSSNTYTGTTTVSAGVLEIQSLTSLGNTATGTVTQSGGTLELNTPFGTISESSYTISGTGSSAQGAITLTSGTSTFVSGTVTLSADATISSESGFLLLNGNTSLGAKTLTVNTTSGTLGFGNNNVISGTGSIIKTGASIATYRQTGTTNNTYTGLTEVQAGTLSTSSSIDGLTLIPGDIKITGGTLSLLHDDNVADTSKIEMAGGELRIQAGGAGSTTVSDTFNTLTLTEDSTITLNHVGVSGTGTIVLNFADSSGTSWTSGKTLTIDNWTGTIGSGGGDDQIFFGNNTSGLTTAQLSQITFEGVNGVLGPTYAAKILSTGEIIPFVPVPEPSTIITGSLVLLFIGYWERKRLLKLWKWFQEKRTEQAQDN